ncbi:efflux RND transporter periplasmic adaptor subunit [Pontibacter sp. H249]|uniref:efflux RND transporter periplasmic adaptor subunit n=1 Tax=Pontibacter sp. H249 TaxID=3133420 RepID=UPI0030BCEF3A
MKRFFVILLTATASFLASCGSEKPAEAITKQSASENNLVVLTPAQMKNAGIMVGKSERKPIADLVQVNGMMEAPPQNLISVSVPLGGYLKKTGLLPGMHLKKGQFMAELEDQGYIQLQQDYLTAKARLSYLEQEYNRQRDLNQSKATSDKVYQQTLADYQIQQVQLKALAERLRMLGVNPGSLTGKTLTRTLRLYSPIDGYVTKVNVNVGKYVVPTDVLFELVDPSDLHLMLTVFEKDLDKLEVGQKIVAYRASQPEKKYSGEIIYIGKDVTRDRAVEVHCHLHTNDKLLVPGMFMNAEIEVQSQDAYTLPNDAIVRYGSKQYVFVVRDSSIFEMVEAQTAGSEQGYTALIPGSSLKPESQTYVLKGAYTLLMKLKNKEEEE